MSLDEISNRRSDAVARLRHWRKNPAVIPAHAALIAGVSRQRVSELLRDGLVVPELRYGVQVIPLSSLVAYFGSTTAKRSKANRLSKPAHQ